MSEHRVTRRSVEAAAEDLKAIASELGLILPGEDWFIDPGSPTYGNKWKIYGRIAGKRHKLSFTGDFDYIGATAKAARDTLVQTWEGLYFVQSRQEGRL